MNIIIQSPGKQGTELQGMIFNIWMDLDHYLTYI